MAVFSNDFAAWQDTIAAIATPPGVGALGIIRLSGSSAISIAGRLMPYKKLEKQPSHTIHVGWLNHNGVRIDEVVASIFRGPKSFTGEDVVEFTCHGSPYILQQVMEALIQLGARPAKPGEFTQRAFLNGKIDLTQAEAVADVIASQSAASHQTALHQMRGGFSHALTALREQLVAFSALIELELDFATEDVEFADRSALSSMLADAMKQVNALKDSFSLGNAIKNGVQVAIIGKPNAGKSTLLNTLLNDNRAIVSNIAGTTRDTIEESLNIDGIIFRLVDTAGIRDSHDEIEAIGVERSREKMRQADIVIYLYDAQVESREQVQEAIQQTKAVSRNFILVANKIDLNQQADHNFGDIESIGISAKSGEGVKTLTQKLVSIVVQGRDIGEQNIVTNARHYAALQSLSHGIDEVMLGVENNLSGDLLAIEIKHCLQALGEITGTITHEDQLDYIFSKFCIGK